MTVQHTKRRSLWGDLKCIFCCERSRAVVLEEERVAKLAAPVETEKGCQRAHTDDVKSTIVEPSKEKIGLKDEKLIHVSTSSPSGDTEGGLSLTEEDFADTADETPCVNLPPDLWSAAYQEAVKNMGSDINTAILAGKSAEHMFEELERLSEETAEKSVAAKGIKRLKAMKVPLERLKFVLDVASPLSAIHPAASTAMGVVKSVTTIAVSIAAMDFQFTEQIGEMLKQLEYINECDTFGQKTNKDGIHRALVAVYEKLLKFYRAVYNVVTRRGIKLMLATTLVSDQLPQIIQEFLTEAEFLRNLITVATSEIVNDIRNMVYDQEISRWLGGDKLHAQGEYHGTLNDLRADEACSFLTTDERYLRWWETDNCQGLALIGDTGRGKSVCMSYLTQYVRERSEAQIVKPKVCYYYCRDDSTGKLSSIVAVLINSLLSQLVGLKKPFVEQYRDEQNSGTPDPAADCGKLKGFLVNIVRSLDRPLVFIIDGLDECDRTSRRMLIELLKEISVKNAQFKYIIATRPHQEILQLLSETEHIHLSSDIERDRIIVRKTIQTKLFHLPMKIQNMILEKLAPMAQGSAIWVKMIISVIEKRHGAAEKPMALFLDNLPLPTELSKLYGNIFSRYTGDDDENNQIAALALKFLAAARRSLSIEELTCAVTLGVSAESVSTMSEIEDLMDCTRLMDLIQPFVSDVNRADLRKRQVQLVHQSVKEYIVEAHVSEEVRPLGADISGRRFSELESAALDLCMSYLLLDDIAAQPLFSDTQLAVIELPQETDLFSDSSSPNRYTTDCSWDEWEEDMNRYDPKERGFGAFWVYASSFWIEHLAYVSSKALPSIGDIEKICHAKSLRLDNWIQQNIRPGCAIQARYQFYSDLNDPLAITAVYGSEAILRHLLDSADFTSDYYLPNPPLAAVEQVLQWGKLSTVGTLFAHPAFKHQLHTFEFFRLLLLQWSLIADRHDNWDDIFCLVSQVFDTMSVEKWGLDLACIAYQKGCKPIYQRMANEAWRNPVLEKELFRIPKLVIPEAVATTKNDANVVNEGQATFDFQSWLSKEIASLGHSGAA